MGCTDGGGSSVEEMKRINLRRARGYFAGSLTSPGKCFRCGCLLKSDEWKKHDEFHFRVDANYEWENGFGVFSEQFKEEYPQEFEERCREYKKI